MKKYTPMRFAHRGLCQHAPENTLGAFEAAVVYGCEGIELDVRLSKDGIPMVVHDKTLDRLSAGVQPGAICELTAAEIQAAPIPYAGNMLPYAPPVPYSESLGSVAVYTEEQVKGFREIDRRVTHIMTFAEFDRWFAGVKEDVTVEVELCSDGLVLPMYEIVKNSPNRERYIFFSGNRPTNEEIQALIKKHGKPEWLRVGANIRWLDEENTEFVKNADLYEVGLNDQHVTPEDVKFLADRGILVFSNLGDYPEWWTAINELGIAAFKTNYAEAYTDWKNK